MRVVWERKNKSETSIKKFNTSKTLQMEQVSKKGIDDF